MRCNLLALVSTTLIASCFAMQSSAAEKASVTLQPASGSRVQGQVTFTQEGSRVRVAGEIRGLTPGAHGFHLHEKGDCSAPDAESAGGHFNPTRMKHGGPKSKERHGGDLGNITADASGNAKVNLTVTGISVASDKPDGIIGRGLVVHAQGDDEKTDPAGNSGARVACGAVKG